MRQSAVYSCILGLLLLLARATYCHATSEPDWVQMIETDDSLCMAHGGQRVSVRLTEAAQAAEQGPVEVWVDRWFMQVQTADHTRQVLTAEAPEKELGCSHSLAGPQHWTLGPIKRLPVAGNDFRKD